MDLPDPPPCELPDEGEPGAVWYCPSCARKFYCTLISVNDKPVGTAWITTEIN